MSAVDLLPCPFCGKAPHVSPVSGGMMASCDPCMIDMLVPEWNRRAPVSAGKVKALVWESAAAVDALSHDEWVAPALGGAFHMAPDEDSASGGWLLQWTIRHEDFCMAYGGAITNHPGPEAAKAAAQADYETRILSALQPGDGWQGIEALIARMDSAAIFVDGDDCAGGNLWRELRAALHPGDGWQGMRPMSDAPKGRARTPILARIRADLAETDPHYGMSNAAAYAGRFVVISHPGVAEDGFDIGWSLHGPFGHGLGSDCFFEGWWPLPVSLPQGEETR